MSFCENKYESWSLDQLKDELRKRQIKVSGRKQDLVQRLVDLDIMGVKETELSPEFHMVLPDRSSYKDVHCEMVLPSLPLNRIEKYFELNNKNFDNKFRDLYKQRFIKYLRAARSTTNITFISGCVWAEMKRTVSYVVDFSFDAAGVIQEAQCECGAGQGPTAHCKHIGCVMYAVNVFSATGDIITGQTCTQTLQTFHHSKPHKGSPLKSQDLKRMRSHDKIEYDPRPAKFKNNPSYQDNFRNIILNYQAEHGTDGKMPMLQLYKPANPYAVNIDHDYGTSSVEYFLSQSKLHNVTKEDRDELERATRSQCSSKSWHQARAVRLTSSNFGTICKMTERRDISKLVEQLLNPVPFRSKATDYGRSYEMVAVQKFEERFGPTQECGLFISVDHPWLGASPDRLYKDHCTVEVKCPYASRDKEINDITIPYLVKEGDFYTLKRNHDYFFQVQGQLLCCKRDICYFCVFTLKDFCVMKIALDQQFVNEMIDSLEAFYDDHFLPGLLEKHVFRSYCEYSW